MSNIETTLSDPRAVEQYRVLVEAILLAGGPLTDATRLYLEQRAAELEVHRLDAEQVVGQVLALPSVQGTLVLHTAQQEQVERDRQLLLTMQATQHEHETLLAELTAQLNAVQERQHEAVEQLAALERELRSLRAAPQSPLLLPDGTELAPIPAGAFMMGSNDRSEEQPVHQVILDAYYIYRTPVTVEQYQRFCTAAGIDMPPGYNADWQQQDQPIVAVSWEDATAYCRWLSGETGLGIALPTEAQWEKAARGTDGRAYPWGNQWDASRLRCSLQSSGDAGGTAPVGSYWGGVSPYGMLDMAGNVWEWCQDWYDAGYYAVSPSRNPTGPETGQKRVMRGGSWHGYIPDHFRCAYRFFETPDNRFNNVGFRCVVMPAWEKE